MPSHPKGKILVSTVPILNRTKSVDVYRLINYLRIGQNCQIHSGTRGTQPLLFAISRTKVQLDFYE